ncbi:MAG: flagellar filament capping protein FliD [Lachnospiraceae bacterium]|nr:flagellar filament capping protein FliD [Lachnospiraceae bacterium]
MAMRISGLASGLDTDAMVKELMSAHSLKKISVEKKKTKAEWTQDKWKELNTKIYKLYTDQVSKLRLQGTYRTKTASSSAEDKVSVTASANAPTGSHTVTVQQLASSQYVTSGDISHLGLTSSSKLSDLLGNNTVINITSGKGENLKTGQLVIDENTTVANFVSELQNVGLNANFDEKQGRFFISSAQSGEDNAFTITTNALTSEAADARQTLKNTLNYNDLSLADKRTVDKALTTLDKNSGASEQEITDAKVALAEIAEKNAKADTEKMSKEFVSGIIKAQLEADDTIVATDDKTREEIIEEKLKEALDSTQTQEKIKYFADNGLNAQTIAQAKDAGVLSEEDMNSVGEYTEFVSSDEAAVVVKDAVALSVEQYQTVETNAGSTNALTAIGLGNVTGAEVKGSTSTMTVVSAADSLITLNGAQLKNSTNSITANGITFNVKAQTKENETITLGVTNDVEGVYNTIKEFVTEYNALLKEMNELYHASSARGYEPLSSDEKEAMSDDEIEKWEEKVKNSLLRRDSTLGSLIDGMRNALNTSISIDGKNYSLSSLGITTSSDYTERGLLHIYGDSEDGVYSGEEDLLRGMLTSDPDKVTDILSGITKNLYEEMQGRMKSSSLSSALTFYNDKYMNNQIKEYDKSIKNWEDKLADMEDKYYKQFAAMESAMEKMNQQSTYLANLFGSN